MWLWLAQANKKRYVFVMHKHKINFGNAPLSKANFGQESQAWSCHHPVQILHLCKSVLLQELTLEQNPLVGCSPKTQPNNKDNSDDN
jgi:hypothetical protein